MKLYLVLLALTVVASVALFGLVNVRKKDEEREEKRGRFQAVKLRVTQDVLGEYQEEMKGIGALLEKTAAEVKALEPELRNFQDTERQKKSDEVACQGAKKQLSDVLASVETEGNNVNAEFTKQKASWEAEMASLQQQIKQRSKVCDFVKKDSEEGRKLCNDEVIKEAPKAEPPKDEAPKQEEPKAEAPKQEAPKAEAPKQEAPKAEAPKQEAPKAEAPKQEAPKAEAPKQEAPKAEDAKAEAPKRR